MDSSTLPPSFPACWQDIWPHLRRTLFLTGAFATAWSYDLVAYGVSHAWANENPLRNQIGFASQQLAPQHLVVLLLQYLAVCAGAAALAEYCHRQNAPWSHAAVTAVEFFPSPVFAGKLMAYLSAFPRLDAIEQAVINLAATWFAATLAHVVPLLLPSLTLTLSSSLIVGYYGSATAATTGTRRSSIWSSSPAPVRSHCPKHARIWFGNCLERLSGSLVGSVVFQQLQ